MTNTIVAVLGTGIMGSAMARNLKSAGMEVRAWNRSRERAEPLAEDGIVVAESAAEAASGGPRLELARSVAALLDGILEKGRGEEDMAVVYEAARKP